LDLARLPVFRAKRACCKYTVKAHPQASDFRKKIKENLRKNTNFKRPEAEGRARQ
jgi:hypothetical protein